MSRSVSFVVIHILSVIPVGEQETPSSRQPHSFLLYYIWSFVVEFPYIFTCHIWWRFLYWWNWEFLEGCYVNIVIAIHLKGSFMSCRYKGDPKSGGNSSLRNQLQCHWRRGVMQAWKHATVTYIGKWNRFLTILIHSWSWQQRNQI